MGARITIKIIFFYYLLFLDIYFLYVELITQDGGIKNMTTSESTPPPLNIGPGSSFLQALFSLSTSCLEQSPIQQILEET